MAGGYSSAPERLEHARVQWAVGGEHAGRAEAHRRPAQVGERATRFAYQHHESGDVENIDVGFDHHIQRTARQQVIVHEIAVATDAPGAAEELAEPPPVRRPREALAVTRGEER